MSENKQLAVVSKQEIEALDKCAATAISLFGSGGTPFEKAFAAAQAIAQLEAMITPAMMDNVYKLMNSPLGFLTDRNPAKKDARGNSPEPYPVETVKSCFIEATLRGVPSIGNCYNIMSSRVYITKEGYTYLLKQLKDFTDHKPFIGLFRYNATREGVVVPCKSTWKMKGQDQSLECEIPMSIYPTDKPDLIIGKATRKLLARVYAQATGTETADGDVSEVQQIGAPMATPQLKNAEPEANPVVKEEPKTEARVFVLEPERKLEPKEQPKTESTPAPQAEQTAGPAENDALDLDDKTPSIDPKVAEMLQKLEEKSKAKGIKPEEILWFADHARKVKIDGKSATDIVQLATKKPDELKLYLDKWEKVESTIIKNRK